MDKTIGYEVVIDPVRGFSDAKAWIYRMIRESLVKCDACDQAATHVFWQDRAEWYCHCEQHRDPGEMWTGSTNWNPSSFSLNVRLDDVVSGAVVAWIKTLDSDEQHKVKIHKFDATNYYKLLPNDAPYTRHYLAGRAEEDGAKTYVDIHPLTTGAYAYQISREWSQGLRGSCHTDAFQGMWATEAEALEAARAEVASASDPDAGDITF